MWTNTSSSKAIKPITCGLGDDNCDTWQCGRFVLERHAFGLSPNHRVTVPPDPWWETFWRLSWFVKESWFFGDGAFGLFEAPRIEVLEECFVYLLGDVILVYVFLSSMNRIHEKTFVQLGHVQTIQAPIFLRRDQISRRLWEKGSLKVKAQQPFPRRLIHTKIKKYVVKNKLPFNTKKTIPRVCHFLPHPRCLKFPALLSAPPRTMLEYYITGSEEEARRLEVYQYYGHSAEVGAEEL